MSMKDVHPLYTAMLTIWRKTTDSYNGEDAIKAAGDIYLKPTSSQILDGYPQSGTTGTAAYEAYKERAVYPPTFEEAVNAAVGVMHAKPATIELPPALEPLRTRATLAGESLDQLLRAINTAQLKDGRIGLLGDIREDAVTKKDIPVITTYCATAIRDWDDIVSDGEESEVRMVKLDESGYEMDKESFKWDFKTRYRLLVLVNASNEITFDAGGVFASGLFDENDSISSSKLTIFNVKGTNSRIPFVFINACDLVPNPAKPPLLGLANQCLAIYRGEADYRQNLFMQGQDTLVKIGAGHSDDQTRTGAGAVINVPIGGDAKYIGVNSAGLPEQREALKNDYNRAAESGGKLVDTTSREKESGEALKIRVAAQTATLPKIAVTGAAGLEKVLKIMAGWYGADPALVKVIPNLEFTAASMDGLTLTQLQTAKGLGAPISEKSIHTYIVKQGFSEMSYEEELKEIGSEEPKV